VKLTQGEAIINVTLQPTTAFMGALKAAKITPPSILEEMPALIDTGFSGGLMIAESLIKNWQLKKRGWSEVGFPRDEQDRYFALFAWDVDIGIKFLKCSYEGGNVLIETSATMVEMLRSKDVQILIGQQILQKAVFTYNGPDDSFTLEFPK
jgi:hypothetical protein